MGFNGVTNAAAFMWQVMFLLLPARCSHEMDSEVFEVPGQNPALQAQVFVKGVGQSQPRRLSMGSTALHGPFSLSQGR